MNVSVLISVYHQESPFYFDLSLKSLYEQTLWPDEIVLVKDGSLTPDLDDIIDKWLQLFEGRLKTVPIKNNVGLSEALNRGLKRCSNDWIARMDTDDICLPDRLAETGLFIKHNPSADIVGTFAIRINEEGRQGKLITVPTSPEQIRKLIWACPMIHPTVCYKKEKILAVGGYNPNAGPRQDDYELWYRCAAAGYEFHNIPKPLLLYRFSYNNMRRNNCKVGYYQMINGFKGNKLLGAGPLAYLGVTIPFFRGLLPYPLNLWFYKLMRKINPRSEYGSNLPRHE